MTHSTEFFEVQKALGFENKSMIQSGFAKLDEQYADRIMRGEKDGCMAIFVDNKMIVCMVDGQEVDADENEIKEYIFA